MYGYVAVVSLMVNDSSCDPETAYFVAYNCRETFDLIKGQLSQSGYGVQQLGVRLVSRVTVVNHQSACAIVG